MAETELRLSVPPVEPVMLSRHFLRTTVCEIRIPALLSITPEIVAGFQKPLRKYYPRYEKKRSIKIEVGEEVKGENHHLLNSQDRHWIVSLKPVAFSLETDNYTSYDEFRGRLRRVIDAATPVIDTDFYTRVGLRYINAIPISGKPLDSAINKDLVLPLVGKVFGRVSKYLQEIRGPASTGSYTLRHGLSEDETLKGLHYLLDFDFYKEDVMVEEALGLLDQFRAECFSFFMWCLGEPLRSELLTPVPTKRD